MAFLRGLFSESHIFTKNSQNFGFKTLRKIGLRVRGFFPAPREPCQLHIRNLKYVRRCARKKLASDKGRHARTVWILSDASDPVCPQSSFGRLFCHNSTGIDTPVQPQTQAMGAARRDPRRGEIPVTRGQARFQCSAPVPGMTVSNTEPE